MVAAAVAAVVGHEAAKAVRAEHANPAAHAAGGAPGGAAARAAGTFATTSGHGEGVLGTFATPSGGRRVTSHGEVRGRATQAEWTTRRECWAKGPCGIDCPPGGPERRAQRTIKAPKKVGGPPVPGCPG